MDSDFSTRGSGVIFEGDFWILSTATWPFRRLLGIRRSVRRVWFEKNNISFWKTNKLTETCNRKSLRSRPSKIIIQAIRGKKKNRKLRNIIKLYGTRRYHEESIWLEKKNNNNKTLITGVTVDFLRFTRGRRGPRGDRETRTGGRQIDPQLFALFF